MEVTALVNSLLSTSNRKPEKRSVRPFCVTIPGWVQVALMGWMALTSPPGAWNQNTNNPSSLVKRTYDPDGRDPIQVPVNGGVANIFQMNANINVQNLLNRVVGNPNSNYYGQCATAAQDWTGKNVNGQWHDAPSTTYMYWYMPVNASAPTRTLVATGLNPDGSYPSAPQKEYQPGGDMAWATTINHMGVSLGIDSAIPGNFWLLSQSSGVPATKQSVPASGWYLMADQSPYDPAQSQSYTLPAEGPIANTQTSSASQSSSGNTFTSFISSAGNLFNGIFTSQSSQNGVSTQPTGKCGGGN